MPIFLAFLLAFQGRAFALDAPSDDFEFFQKEAALITPSRRPSSASQSPATVYVVTSEDIQTSGAQTLWDALRAVPGVDVMSERTSQGDVSIRGLNGPLNNRTLVLLDGKTVLNGFLDYTDWETIPVSLEEIDRIEVVEGPASALYGGNAVNGVINIITKSPETLKGGVVSYTGGERNTQVGTALIGDKWGAQAFKLDLSGRSTNRFSQADRQASSVGKAHGLYRLDLPGNAAWSVSGGIADHDVNVNNGPSDDKGRTGFARTDFKRGGTAARFFWNWGRTEFQDHPIFPFDLHYDTYDLNLEQALDLPFDNALTAGGNFRRNRASSNIFAPGARQQDLWALFFENTWKPAEHWSVVASGRGDHHPLTGWQFSPRGSVIYAPAAEHVVRLTAASAFRNPTLFEDYVDLVGGVTAPGIAVNFHILPSPGLQPEKIQFFEAAYRGSFDRIKTAATGYYYRVTNIVTSPPPDTTVSFVPIFTINTSNSLTNDGETKALGGELGAEVALWRQLSSFANYSYECLIDQLQRQTTARSAPRHKVNAGLRLQQGGWTANVSGDWVGKTSWTDGADVSVPVYVEVRSYFVLNASVRYRFSGRWEGLEAAVSGFNIADRHYETLPLQSSAAKGQNAEKLLARWSGTIAYRFGL